MPCLTPVGQLPLPARLSKWSAFSWGRCLVAVAKLLTAGKPRSIFSG